MKRLWYHLIMISIGIVVFFVSAHADTKRVRGYRVNVLKRALFGFAQGITLDGDTLYVAANNSVVTISLTNIYAPKFSGFSYPEMYIQDLCVGDDYIYATLGDSGIEVIPKAAPDDPGTIKIYDFGTFIDRITIDRERNILYAAARESGILIIQAIGDSLTLISNLTGDFNRAYDVEYFCDTLIVGGSEGVGIYDVSNPYSPSLVQSFFTGHGAFRVKYGGGIIVYAMNWVSDWQDYYSVETFNNGIRYVINQGEGRVMDISLQDSHLFVLTYGGRIFHYVFSQGVTQIDDLSLGSSAHAMDVDSAFVYVVEDDGVSIIRYVNGTLEPVSSVYSTPTPYGLVSSRSYLFSAAGQSGIVIIDISDTLNPAYAGRIPCNNYPVALDVKDTLLLCAALYQNFSIFNISDPNYPVFLGEIFVPGNPMDIAWKDSIVYIATNTEGVALVNVGRPDNPLKFGMLHTGRNTKGVIVYNNFLVVSDIHNETFITNVVNPVSPSIISTLPPSEKATLNDSILILATPDSRLKVYNISNPVNPALMYTITIPWKATSLKLRGNMVYVACGNAGMRVYKLEEDSAIYEGYYVSGNRINDIYPVTPWLFYISEESGGIYLMEGTFKKVLYNRARRKKTNVSTVTFTQGNIFRKRITFSVNTEKPMLYKIIDASGRVVKKGRTFGRGEIQVQGVKSGVYFLQVHSTYSTRTHPLIVK